MMHAAPPRLAWLGTVVLFGLLAGCGGESSVSVGVPTDSHGPLIVGQVLMPNGELAAAPSTWDRVASAVVARVEALVNDNVRPVGAGVGVRLLRIGNNNIVNGQIKNPTTVAAANTGGDGGFGIRLPTGTTPDTCRFLIEVGSGRSLTRAFVDSDQLQVDFESEAAVRLVLQQIQQGKVSLCDLDANELHSIRTAVEQSDHEAFGDTAAVVNSSAVIAASTDPSVQAAISQAIGEPTPPPVATNTAPPQATHTNTAVVPTATQAVATATAPPTRTNSAGPTRTNTAAPTRTNTNGPTRTSTAVPTDTVAPTRTNTPVPTNTVAAPTRTNTSVPISTATATGVPTGTATIGVPTATAVPPTATVAPPTATSTSAVPTSTVVFTPTATPAVAEINLGVIAGTAGFTVEVPVVLVSRGVAIAATSNDIEFDASALSLVLVDDQPDCTVDARLAGVKQVVAQVGAGVGGRQRLRVGVIGRTNNTLIASGVLFSCRFAVAVDAPASIELLNGPEAAGPNAELVTVIGSDGRIDVSKAPLTLALSAGTAAVGAPVEVTATLLTDEQPVAAVSTDLRFDSNRLSVALDGADPDCTLSPAAVGLGKELIARALPSDEDGVAGVRVGVFGRTNNTALPSGALFSCRFSVLAAGGPIALEHSPEGASPAAQPVGIFGQPGTISVP